MSGVWRSVRNGAVRTRRAVANASNTDTIRLAVTGLSRAGKTVFMVSLISNLLAMGRGVQGQRVNTLPKLAELLADGKRGSRLLSVEIEPSGVQRIPRFPYEAYRDGLAAGPAAVWPPFTEQPAMLALRLTVKRSTGMGSVKRLMFGAPIV